MASDPSNSSAIKYTGGIRDKSGNIQRFNNPKDAYNSTYNDVHAKLNGKSSWVKPSTTISQYISKFAPVEDSNDPVSYTKHVIEYINSKLKNTQISEDSTMVDIKKALIAEGLDPEHELTKAHLGIEDPKVLVALGI